MRNVTPEEILRMVEARFGAGPVPATDVWRYLVESLEGQGTTWTKRTVKRMRDEAAAALLQEGKSVTWVVAHTGLRRRKVERINRARLQSRRSGEAA